MPGGSSAPGEHLFGPTFIPWQTDITITYIYGAGKAKKHIFMQLPRKAIVFFHIIWGKESKKEGVARVFSRKKQHFLHQAHWILHVRLWTPVVAECPGWILDVEHSLDPKAELTLWKTFFVGWCEAVPALKISFSHACSLPLSLCLSPMCPKLQVYSGPHFMQISLCWAFIPYKKAAAGLFHGSGQASQHMTVLY